MSTLNVAQEKIFAHSRLALRSFGTNMYVVPHIFLLLTFIKIKYNVFYEELKNQDLYEHSDIIVWDRRKIQENRAKFKSQFPKALNSEYFVVVDQYEKI